MVESEYNLAATRARWHEEHLDRRFKRHGFGLIINDGFQKAQLELERLGHREIVSEPQKCELLEGVG